MSKKSNTIFFLIGATVFNVLITVVSFLVLIVIYGRFIAPRLPEQAASWGLPVIFVGAIALAFVIYRTAVKFLLTKIDAEKTFDPLFRPRRPRRKD